MTRTARLLALYAKVPKIECLGKCWESCGPIAIVQLEHERIGKPKQLDDTLDCPVLTPDNACSQYERRPLICRLWGVVKGMPCPFGCVAERILSDEEAHELLDELKLISSKIVAVNPAASAAVDLVLKGGL